MRIKNFRMFEKSDEVFFTDEEKIDIEDICQEIKDDGLSVEIRIAEIRINNFDYETPFTMTETLFETIKRLEDYLDRSWFKVEVILSGENERREIYMDKSSHKVFFMSDRQRRGNLLGSSLTRIKKLYVEI